jgi:hypothetical protein
MDGRDFPLLWPSKITGFAVNDRQDYKPFKNNLKNFL